MAMTTSAVAAPAAYDRRVTWAAGTDTATTGGSGTAVAMAERAGPGAADALAEARATGAATRPAVPVEVPEITRRRLAPSLPSAGVSWMVTGGVVLIAAILRLVNLSFPKSKIFDELYYATEGHEIWQYGVEWNYKTHSGDLVVHPPLGKWLIGAGEAVFGYNSFGWRIMPAIAGIVSVLLVTRLAYRLFRSNVLAGAAGLLMAMDGMNLVLSRSALLDIFLMTFLLAAFFCLVLDRDQRRRSWLHALERGRIPRGQNAWLVASPARPGGLPWWRIAAAVLTACAMGVKWSAIWFVPAFLLLIYVWEVGARRSVGVRRPWLGSFASETGWVLLFLGLFSVVYLATWTGWLVTDYGWDREWLAQHGQTGVTVPYLKEVLNPLINLYHYHRDALHFHVTLDSPHKYQSWPWQWLLLGRPVAFYWSGDGPCGASQCASEILLLGTPALWWAFIPALAGLAWFGISRRDWRAGAIALCAAVGIVPWFWYELSDRTMFYFYALPSEPFLILAVVYALGAIMRPAPDAVLSERWLNRADRRLIGTVLAGVFMFAVTACFFYFYPIYVGKVITYSQWWGRMWLGGRWV